MKAILTILAMGLLAPIAAIGQNCQNQFDPMSGQWRYVCAPTGEQPTCKNQFDAMSGQWRYVCGSGGRTPTCKNQFDPMNGKWRYVCDDGQVYE